MTEESTGEWISCIIDDNYEIWTEYPHPIRKKGSDRVISEWHNKEGYVRCKLSGKPYQKHRIIAQQFIPNPENKTEVDHINHDKADNRIENLRWTNHSENQKNRSSFHRRQYTFLDELPETAEPLEFYGNHGFDDLWIDYGTQKLYLFNGIKYREQLIHQHKFQQYYTVCDTEGKHVNLYLSILFD